jgi:preprotein translocase subunit YajC
LTCENVTQFLCQLLLAQGQAAPPADPNAPMRWMGSLAVIMVLFYFMLIRPQKKKEQELRNLIANVKENDRVVTIGGIHGVVTNVQRDLDRLTIRVDESTGAKLKVNMAAIARVLTGDESEGATGEKKS